MKGKCKICNSPEFSKLLCKYHYLRKWKDERKAAIANGTAKGLRCKICGDPQMSKMLCRSHYMRQWWAARRVHCIDGRPRHEWLGGSKCRVCGLERNQ